MILNTLTGVILRVLKTSIRETPGKMHLKPDPEGLGILHLGAVVKSIQRWYGRN